MRHEPSITATRVIPQYEVDTLGAPFKVTVWDCVTLRVDPSTGKELINIPDLVGLINAVVRARVKHSRKLNGQEIKFIRNALGVKGNAIASFLAMSPEHLSRCEAGTKVMSAISEKVFRLFAYLATFHPDPNEILAKREDGDFGKELEKKAKRPNEVARNFVEQFLTMKIESAFDAEEELNFNFWREADPENFETSNDQDSEWEPKPQLACCG